MPVRSHGQISCVRLRTGVHYPEKLPEGLPPRTLGVEHVVGATVTGTGENMRRGPKARHNFRISLGVRAPQPGSS